MSYTAKLTETQQDNLDVRIVDIAKKHGKRTMTDATWTFANHETYRKSFSGEKKLSAFLFMCIFIGVIAAISEEWGIVFFCLILGSCTA
jgi:hypothetical protein